MKKKVYVVPLLLSLLLVLGYASAHLLGKKQDSRSPASSAQSTVDGSRPLQESKLTLEQCVAQLDAWAKQSGNFSASVNDSRTEVFFIGQIDGLAAEVQRALDGDADCINAWDEMCPSLVLMTSNAKKFLIDNGHELVSATLYVINDAAPDNALFAASDGAILYNVLEGVEAAPSRSVPAEELSAFFAVCEYTDIFSQQTSKKAEIHIVTEYSADDAPEDWSGICASLVAALDAYANGNLVSAQIETQDGTILANAFRGALIYDKFGAASVTRSTGRSSASSSSLTVYVTPSGTHYHKTRTCGGENSYAISISNVGSRTACSKCW